MEYASLYDLIRFIEKGTKIHIGVLFFGNYGNDHLILPYEHKIHVGAICEHTKSTHEGYHRCLSCRTAAIRRAKSTRKPYGGFCVSGVYEYVHPILHGDEVCAVIYIGNIIVTDRAKARLISSLGDAAELVSTLEADITASECKDIALLIEGYVKLMLEKYGYRNISNDFDPRIENIKMYIQENLEYLTDLSILAKNFGYNKKYIGRLFKSKTGTTIDEYVNQRRIDVAQQLLSTTDDSIISISSKVGYNNVSYFNRIFKETLGITPSEYRRDRR